MKKLMLMICSLVALTQSIFPGDIAKFVNLGFSKNAHYFMFAQYGVESHKSTPYAELFYVDVPDNTFVKDGKSTESSTNSVEPGDNGQGALFNIIEKNLPLTKKLAIDHLRRGRILYFLIDGEQPKAEIQFRDFNTGKKYKVLLIQSSTGKDEEVKAAFHIELTITTSAGKEIKKTVGLASYQRQGVKSYRIRQIICAPDEKSLIFMIEKEEYDPEGINVRYMVETVKTE